MAALPRRLHTLAPSDGTPGPRVSLLSWNVLADGLAQHGSFVRAPPAALEWPHRRALILEELRKADADLIALQEVNRFEELEEALRAQGYVGAFAAKRCSPCVGLGFPGDGLALFFRASRFKALGEARHASFVAEDGSTPLSQCFLYRALLDLQSQRTLLVANTHLKAKASPEFDAVRLMEATQLLTELERASAALPADAQPPGVLLCGDFNTTLDARACRAVTASALGLAPVARDVPSADAFSTWKFRPKQPGGSELAEKRCVIDHVWHSAPALRHVAMWAQPTRDECGLDALPSMAYPSDHIAQFNVFEW